METMSIVIRDDSYDKILTPLAFAYLQAAEGTHVDILFVNWAVRALTEDGAAAMHILGEHAKDEPMVRAQVAKAGLPPEIIDILRALKATNSVKLYACSLAASIFGVTEENLIPEAEGIIGASWFLNEKASKADHYQYF